MAIANIIHPLKSVSFLLQTCFPAWVFQPGIRSMRKGMNQCSFLSSLVLLPEFSFQNMSHK